MDDESELSNTATVNITITEVNDAPVVTQPANQDDNVGDTVSLTIVGSDVDGPSTIWSATGLPAGLSINSSTGVISGTLTTANTYSVTVTLRDGGSPEQSDSKSFTWTVNAVACDPATEVEYNGYCYYLDGSNGVCDSGYSMAPQSVLNTIAGSFVGKNYKHQVSNNCCIDHLNEPTEGQDWGMPNQCNTNGPFTSGNPAAGGAGCTDAHNHSSNQLTLCMKSAITYHMNGIFYVSDDTFTGDFNAAGGFCTTMVGQTAYIAGNTASLPDDEIEGTWQGNGSASNTGTNCALYSSANASHQGYGVKGGYGACSQSRHVVCSTDPAYCNGYGLPYCYLWD
ncbi:MAG: hypothetical protein HN348_22760 [Proteobacteria bacterium]|nr:hypothetical protein [Pseudomonadota bacterium]